MIFKPSSLHKLFFTYICPRFYGGAPAAPSNTTSTQTVNQSPWQNPVYQALMLGTKDQPGPATSMLNASREQMAQWNAINKTGLTPSAQASLGTWNPATPNTTSSYVNQLNTDTGQYIPMSGDITRGVNQSYQTSLGRAPDTAGQAYWANKINSGVSQQDVAKSIAASQEAQAYAAKNAPAASPIEQSAAQGGLMGLSGYASGGKLSKEDTAAIEEMYKKYMGRAPDAEGLKYWGDKLASGTSTRDIAASIAESNEAKTYASTTHTPPYGLMDTMKNVAFIDPNTLQSTLPDFLAIQKTARNLKTPEQFAAATDMYGKSTAGLEAAAGYKPTDVNATKADVASAASQGYTAANMQGAAGVSASPLTDYQMKGPSDVNAPTAATAQMQGPASWLDPGTSQAYMDPYVQNVINQEKAQSNRDYQQQLNQLNAQSVKSGAFGGSRQAIQQSEAARNQAFNLANIEAKGLENAYTQGAQQFNTAQGQQLQAGQANLTTAQQTNLANQAAQIQAMMANQGMDYNTAFQNLQARMGIQNTASSQDLQAAMANQQAQQQTQAANQASKNAASQFNAGAQNTANLANQQAANTASNAYTQQQLAANQANQQAGLQANQQGIGALQGVASNASGLTSTGSAANAANLANLGAQGQVAQAEQNLGQSYLDAQSANATSWLNAPTSINAGVVNTLGGQNVQGGTATTTGTAKPASWARGGLIKNGKVSKGSKK